MAKRVIDIYYDVPTRTFMDSNGRVLSDESMPEFCYMENPLVRLRLVRNQNQGDPYFELGGAAAYSASMDNDFEHGEDAGQLSTAVSGNITELAVNGLDASKLPAAGMIDLMNAADESESISYTGFSEDSGTVTFSFAETALTYSYAQGDTAVVSLSPLMFKTENDGINVEGDWEGGSTADPWNGQFSIRVNADTIGYFAKIGSDEELPAYRPARFELQALDFEGILQARIHFRVKASNLVDTGSKQSPPLPKLFYTKTENDAKFMTKVPGAPGNNIAVFDDQGQVQNSTVAISDNPNLGDDDSLVPTQHAVRDYVHQDMDFVNIEMQESGGAGTGYDTIHVTVGCIFIGHIKRTDIDETLTMAGNLREGETPATDTLYIIDLQENTIELTADWGDVRGRILALVVTDSSDATKFVYQEFDFSRNGDVTGSLSAVGQGEITVFASTAGKHLASSGCVISTDDTLSGDSDGNIPTEHAVKTYVDARAGAQDLVNFTRSINATAGQFDLECDFMFIGPYPVFEVDLTLDTANSAGENAIDTGAWEVSKTYGVWALYGPSGVTLVASLATSYSGVTKPSGYDAVGRLVGHVRTTSGTATAFEDGKFCGNTFSFLAPWIIFNDTLPTSYQTLDLTSYAANGINALHTGASPKYATGGVLFSYNETNAFAGCKEMVVNPITIRDCSDWSISWKAGSAPEQVVLYWCGWEDNVL